MPQLSEKPRLGFATKKTTWNPGPNVCNFTVTLGLQVVVSENGVRKTYRARYYNPNTGRFMSRDPLNGYSRDPKSLHKYLYAGGDPVNAMDPTGRGILEIGELDLGVAFPGIRGLVTLAGGTVATVTSWAIAVEFAAEQIAADLALAAAEEAAGASAIAWNMLVAAVNEYYALLLEESAWGGVSRLLLCTEVGLISAQIAEHDGILSPDGAHLEEVTSILGCGIGLEFMVKR
jgi:RHS repeat-associated protein